MLKQQERALAPNFLDHASTRGLVYTTHLPGMTLLPFSFTLVRRGPACSGPQPRPQGPWRPITSAAPTSAISPAALSCSFGGALALGIAFSRRHRAAQASRQAYSARDLLPEEAESWEELAPVEGYQFVVADLDDLDRCMAVVVPSFNVGEEEGANAEGVDTGIAERLGARRGIAGTLGTPRPSFLRPAKLGSWAKPDLGLVLALAPEDDITGPFAGVVDLSLWPADGRVRTPGAQPRPYIPSKPYILNLCVDPNQRRKGFGRALMSLAERVIRDLWGDNKVYLHVEEDKKPANGLYESMSYLPLEYVNDPQWPFTPDELKVFNGIIWRCKQLGEPSVDAPVQTGSLLRLEEEFKKRDEEARRAWAAEMGFDEEEEEEEEQADEEGKPKAEDFSWVSSLIR